MTTLMSNFILKSWNSDRKFCGVLRALLQKGTVRCCQWSLWQMNVFDFETRSVSFGLQCSSDMQTFYKLPFSLTLMPLTAQMHSLPLKRVIKSPSRSSNESLRLSSLLTTLLTWRKMNSDTRSQESHTATTRLPNRCSCRTSYGAYVWGSEAVRLVRFTWHSRKLWLWTHVNSHIYCKGPSFFSILVPSETKRLSLLPCSVVDFIKLMWEPLCLRVIYRLK